MYQHTNQNMEDLENYIQIFIIQNYRTEILNLSGIIAKYMSTDKIENDY